MTVDDPRTNQLLHQFAELILIGDIGPGYLKVAIGECLSTFW